MGTASVLLVDDETAILSSVGATLSGIGYDVHTACTVNEAIKVFANHKIDVVLSDIFLHEDSGLDLLDHIRDRALDVPVILFTGRPDIITAIESVRKGAYDYLLKPLTMERLKGTVKKALDYYQLLEQKKSLEIQNESYRTELERKNDELEDRIHERTAELQSTVETLKKTQEKLIQSHKLESMSKLISGFAHELNNLLTPILLSAELLHDLGAEGVAKESIETVIDSTIKAKNIVLTLLSFARKDIPVRVWTDLNAVIRETVELVEYQCRTNGISIELNLDKKLPEVYCNPGEMGQVFLNILNNARSAIIEKGSGTISIKSSASNGRVAIGIRDSGIGIPEENMLKLFDPFFTTKEKTEATGLGLSVCYGIVYAHGGEIKVASQDGIWAEFTVDLPIKPPDGAKPEAASIRKSAACADISPETVQKILIIDDEDNVRRRVQELLRTIFRAEILTAADGRGALEMIQRTDYDLIITDIRMPGLDGIRLYRWLKMKDVKLQKKFVFMTGDTFDAGVKEFLEKENIPYVIKPFTADELKEKLNVPTKIVIAKKQMAGGDSKEASKSARG
jgi:two-component system NtrC family sensor kinase